MTSKILIDGRPLRVLWASDAPPDVAVPPKRKSGAQRKNELRQRGVTAPPSIVQRGRPRAGKAERMRMSPLKPGEEVEGL